jgi:two-component system response regulator
MCRTLGTYMQLREPWLLLVEDSPSDRELTLIALAQGNTFPHRVENAHDGAMALDLLFCRGDFTGRDKADLPRAILLDVNMPLVNGLEVLREIKADEQLREIPVVMLTSSAERRDLHTSYSLGANSYVVKPVDIDDFFEAVRGVGKYWLTLNHAGETLV